MSTFEYVCPITGIGSGQYLKINGSLVWFGTHQFEHKGVPMMTNEEMLDSHCRNPIWHQKEGQDFMIELAVAAWAKHKPIFETPKLLAVPSIYESNFRDVVKTLRRIADEIEQGVFGEVNNAALVLLSDKIDAFHMGQGQALEAYVLFDMGKEFLRGAILDGMKAR